MNRYQTSTPRAAIGLAAAALTALTLAVAVLLPAGIDAGAVDEGFVLAGKSFAPAPTTVPGAGQPRTPG